MASAPPLLSVIARAAWIASVAAAVDAQSVLCAVTSDSVHSRFEARRALDGDTESAESRWASAKRPGPHWIAFEFDRAVAFDEVVVYGHAGDLALADAALEVTAGDGTWTTLAAVEGNAAARIELRFPETTARVARLFITRACRQDDCARLFEVRFLHGGHPLPLRPVRGFAGPRLGPRELVLAVDPLPDAVLDGSGAEGRRAHRMADDYASIRDWARVVSGAARPVPGRPGETFYGGGSHLENDVRAIAYAALINAFVAGATPPEGVAPPADAARDRARAEAVGALRYLVRAHVTGGGACVDGVPWGDQWQSAMWARSVGLAGWILWPRLDDGLRAGVADVVAHEADRFLLVEPKSSVRRDTGAEENAWNAQIFALAANMLVRHPRCDRWATAAKVWAYNSLSVAADGRDDRVGDDGRAIRDWVHTVNVHDDFTVENHGIVHVGYLKTSVALLLEGALPYLVRGRRVPAAFLHHARECFDAVAKVMAWNGAPVYVSGNDWKLVRTQGSDVMLYALMGLLAKDAVAARLEEVALPEVRRIQAAEGGHYSVRRDLEFGGVCATRLVAAYLAHARVVDGAPPATDDAVDARTNGVTLFAEGRVIVHRTPTKLASFSWGPERMALSIPRDGTALLWPHFGSYTGLVDGRTAGDATEVAAVGHELGADRFTATAILRRAGGRVEQAVAFASLPSDVTVYVERLTPVAGEQTDRETGVVGLEYDVGRNAHTLHGRFGTRATRGVGGETRVVGLRTDWLNLDDRVGWVVCRDPARDNVVRYHDETAGSGRVPKLQEWISLVGDPGAGTLDRREWACVVTGLNADARATRALADAVRFLVSGDDTATCRVGTTTVHVDFGSLSTHIDG